MEISPKLNHSEKLTPHDTQILREIQKPQNTHTLTHKREFLGGVKTRMFMKVISTYYKEIKREEEKLQKINPTKEKIWGVINKIREARKMRKKSQLSHNQKLITDQNCKKFFDKLVIFPANIFKIVLDHIFNILIYIDLIIMPFNYLLLNTYFTNYNREFVFDSCFLFEILLTFFTAYMLDGRLIKDFKTIALSYLKFLFWLDLAYSFPFYIFWPELIFLRLIKIYRYPSLIERIRKMIFVLNSFCIKNIKILHGVTEILIILIHLIFLIHYSGVIYVFIGSIDDGVKNWIAKANISNFTIWEKYLVAVYFIIETFISVGYGDFTPASIREIIYIMSTQILFVGLLAYLISCIIAVFKNLHIKEMTISNKLNKEIDLDAWIAGYNNQISDEKKKELYKKNREIQFFNKIEYYFMMYYKLDHRWIRNLKFMQFIRPAEKNILLDEIFSHLFGFFHNFFVEIDRHSSFKRTIAMNLEASFLEKNSVLIKEKPEDCKISEIDSTDEIKYLYFICNGKVNVSKKNVEICEYTAGSYFGDEVFIFSNPFFTYRSLDKTVFLFRLPISTLVEICSYDEKAYLILLKKSLIRLKNLNEEFNKNKKEQIRKANMNMIKSKYLIDDDDTKISVNQGKKKKIEIKNQKHPESVPNPVYAEFKNAFSSFDNKENLSSINERRHSFISNASANEEVFCDFDLEDLFSNLDNLNEIDLNTDIFGDFPKILKEKKKHEVLSKILDTLAQKTEYLNRKLDNAKNNFLKYVANVREIIEEFQKN